MWLCVLICVFASSWPLFVCHENNTNSSSKEDATLAEGNSTDDTSEAAVLSKALIIIITCSVVGVVCLMLAVILVKLARNKKKPVNKTEPGNITETVNKIETTTNVEVQVETPPEPKKEEAAKSVSVKVEPPKSEKKKSEKKPKSKGRKKPNDAPDKIAGEMDIMKTEDIAGLMTCDLFDNTQTIEGCPPEAKTIKKEQATKPKKEKRKKVVIEIPEPNSQMSDITSVTYGQ